MWNRCSDRSKRVNLVGQDGGGTGPRPAGPDTGHLYLGEGQIEGDRVVTLPEGGDEPQRPASAVHGDVKLGREAASRSRGTSLGGR